MLERAFQLARTGTVRSVEDIRRTLKAERYDSVDAHVAGGLAKQLRDEIRKRMSAKMGE